MSGIQDPPGVGIDAVDVARFRRLLDRRPAVSSRLFTDGERAYGHGFADPVPHLAARFAAKEAAMKALGVGIGSVSFKDIEVGKMPGGAPCLTVRGSAAALAEQQGVTGWRVSLTHTEVVAQALVMVTAAPAGEGNDR